MARLDRARAWYQELRNSLTPTQFLGAIGGAAVLSVVVVAYVRPVLGVPLGFQIVLGIAVFLVALSIILPVFKALLKWCFTNRSGNRKGDPVTIEQARRVQVEQLDPEMAKALFDLTKEAPERQVTNLTSLDTKMVQIFQAASVVIAFLGLSSSVDIVQGHWWILLLVVGALACYFYSAVLAFKHLEPREFWRNLETDRWLSSQYQDLDEDGFRRLVILDTGRAYRHNNEILDRKAKYVRCALASVGVEVFLVVLVLILSRFLFSLV